MGISAPQARPQSAAAFQVAPPVSSESACESAAPPQGGLASSGLLDASSASFLDVTGQSDTTLLQPPESPAHAAHVPSTLAEGRPPVDLNHNVRPKADIKQEGAGGYGSPAALAPAGGRRQCLAPSVALPGADAAGAGGGNAFENELRAAAAHKMALSIRSFSITDAEYEALDDAARASPQSPAPSPHALAAHEPLAAYTIGAFLPEAQEASFAEGVAASVAAGGGQHYGDEYKKESAGEGDGQGTDGYAGVLPSAHFDVACYEAAGGDSGFLHQPHPAAHGGFSGSPFHDARTTSSSSSDAHGDKDGGFAEAYGSYLHHQFGTGVAAHEGLLGGTPRHQTHLHLQHPHLHPDKARAASGGPPPPASYSASSPSSSNSTSTSLASSSPSFAPASAAGAMPSLAGSTILLNPMALLADSECEGAAAGPKMRQEFSTLDLAALQEEAHEVVICE